MNQAVGFDGSPKRLGSCQAMIALTKGSRSRPVAVLSRDSCGVSKPLVRLATLLDERSRFGTGSFAEWNVIDPVGDVVGWVAVGSSSGHCWETQAVRVRRL